MTAKLIPQTIAQVIVWMVRIIEIYKSCKHKHHSVLSYLYFYIESIINRHIKANKMNAIVVTFEQIKEIIIINETEQRL